MILIAICLAVRSEGIYIGMRSRFVPENVILQRGNGNSSHEGMEYKFSQSLSMGI